MPDTAELGHNLAPTDANPLHDRLAEDFADLLKRSGDLLEAAGRVPTVIEDNDTAGRVTDFIKQIQGCMTTAESHRKKEKEPFLEAGRTVDGWFKKVTDPLDKAKKEVTARLTAFQRKKAEEERRQREAEERRAREEAERARREAEEKAAALAQEDDLDAAVAAEEAANHAAEEAAKAERDADAKAADLSRNRGDYGGVSSLRTFWNFRDLDRRTLDLEPLRDHLPADALDKAVRSFVKAGGRELRGVTIFEDTQTVVR